jgi:hypothetical protein
VRTYSRRVPARPSSPLLPRRAFLAGGAAALLATGATLRGRPAAAASNVRWIAAAPAGAGTGLSPDDAAGMADLPALATAVGPGGSILLLATQPFVLPADGSHAVLRTGGSGTAPITIRGANPDGTEAVAEIRSNRARPWQPGSTPGGSWLELGTGARQLVLRGLRFVDVGRPIWATAAVPGLTLQTIEADNVEQLLDVNTPSTVGGGGPLGSYPKLHVNGVVANGFTAPLLSLRGVTNGLIESVQADAAHLETDFVKGIAFVGIDAAGASSGVTVRNCDLRGLHGLSSKYLQGDGITSEGYDRRITIEDCTITDCFDGGIDLKSAGSVCRRVTVTNAKRSFRFHAPAADPTAQLVLMDCHSIDPVFPGGTGHADHIQSTGAMVVRSCTFADRDPALRLVEVNDGAVVRFDGGSVSHPGPLVVDDRDGVVKGLSTLQLLPERPPSG